MADKRIPQAVIKDVWTRPGGTTADLSLEVGLSRSSLWRRAKKMGLPARKGGRAYTISDEARFTRLWNGGVAVADISAALGVGIDAVFCTRRRLNLAPRPHGTRPIPLAEFELREGMARAAADTKRALISLEMIDKLQRSPVQNSGVRA